MDNLQIFTIELKNYRQYAGKTTIDLRVDGNRKINIVQGENGAGKSNLLNAITLCFYDSEEHLDDDDDLDELPMVNRKAMDDVTINGNATGYVKITLGRDEPEYIFTREFKTVKLGENSFTSSSGDLELQHKKGRDWERVENPNTYMNEILPGRVKDYFLFDGEDLNGFFGAGYTDRVRDAILDVSHIDLLNSASEHLENVAKDIDREGPEAKGRVEHLKQKRDEAQQELEDLRDKHDETWNKIENTKENIDSIDNKLQDIKNPDVQRKLARRDTLEADLKDEKSKLKEVEQEANDALLEAGQIVYALDALEFTLEKFEELSEKGQLPPKIQEWFIDDLLEQGECFCGADLNAHPEKRERLKELKSEMNEVSESNLEGKTRIPQITDDGESAADTLLEKRSEIRDIEEEIESINTELKDISEELKNYDIPDDVNVSNLEKQRSELESQKEDLIEKAGQLKSDINQQKEVVNNRKQEYRRAAEKKDEYREMIRKIDFLEDTREDVENIKETILDQIRQETEDSLNEYFNELIWKDERYDIVLGDDYSVEVRGPRGDNKIGSLSAGEKQVLALSFMSALTNISGFTAPIVIDTPLGRISGENKRRIARNIPDYLEDTQLTFLMTDQEYDEEVQMRMDNHVANEYLLNFANEETNVTKLPAEVSGDD